MSRIKNQKSRKPSGSNVDLSTFNFQPVTVASGPHTAEEVHRMLLDWRVLLSVGLGTIILWLAYRWFRLGRSSDP